MKTVDRPLVLLWAVGGVLILIIEAVWRLAPMAFEALSDGLTTGQGLLFVTVLVFMLYSEGYRGFQKMFSPRVVARALILSRSGSFIHILFAPLIVSGLFVATRRRLVIARTLVTAIVILVIAVRTLDQPWRGIVDGGVVAGLAYGIITLLVFTTRAFIGKIPTVDPEFPSGMSWTRDVESLNTP